MADDPALLRGIRHANGPTVHDEAQMPFGGEAGAHKLTELRWVTVQTTERHHPF